MKFMHLGDLHLGKRVNEFPMIEDQKEILKQIIELADKEKINGLFIAGDIYDKTIPSIEAIELFESFIEKINLLNIPSFIVSGNHDSVERLSIFANLIKTNKIYISKPYSGKLEPIIIKDIAIWLLPFIRPSDVRKFHTDIEIGNYQEAITQVLNNIDLDESKINILIAHQFVTANGKSPETSDSESCSLGTLDSVDFRIFDKFNYVALGHIHKPQAMGRQEVRYCGSPLKYSFSEVNQKKSITILEITDKNNIDIQTFNINPIRDLKEIKGTLEDLLANENDESYMHITLTDISVIDAKNKLETIYPNIMKLDFEEYNQIATSCGNLEKLKSKSLYEHFSDFFEKQTSSQFNEEEQNIVAKYLNENEEVDL